MLVWKSTWSAPASPARKRQPQRTRPSRNPSRSEILEMTAAESAFTSPAKLSCSTIIRTDEILNSFTAQKSLRFPAADTVISGVQSDSRKVKPGLLCSHAGRSTDGNLYIDSAIAAGAIAVVTDSAQQPRAVSAWAFIKPGHGRRVLDRSRQILYGHPAKKLAWSHNGNQWQDHDHLFDRINTGRRSKKSALIGPSNIESREQ